MIPLEIVQRLLQSKKDKENEKKKECNQKTKENSEHLLGK